MSSCKSQKNTPSGARIMAKWGKVFAAKTDDLSWIPGDPHGGRRKPTSNSCTNLHMYSLACVHMYTHVQTHRQLIK